MNEIKCNEHSGVCTSIANLQIQIDKADDKNCTEHAMIMRAINELRNRLPNWATLLISVMAMAIGWLFSAVFR